MARHAKPKPKKTSRIRHLDEHKGEAVKLAEKVGVGTAAEQLGLHESQLSTWWNKARQKESSGGAAGAQKATATSAAMRVGITPG